jgi:hypothetical protein
VGGTAGVAVDRRGGSWSSGRVPAADGGVSRHACAPGWNGKRDAGRLDASRCRAKQGREQLLSQPSPRARRLSLVRARARGGPVPQFATPGAIGGSSQQPGGGMAKTSDVTRARKAAAPVPIEIRLGEAEPESLRAIGASRSDRFNNALIAAAVSTGWFPPGQPDEERSRQLFVAVTSLQPADEIEGMIAAQALAAHHASMECSRRAMLADQPFV